MDANAFRAMPSPPEKMDPPLKALWHAGRGEWDKAYALVQDEESAAAAWVHAHLHRVEGDLDNAGHWYGQAGKKLVGLETDDEWKEIADALLLEGGW